MLRPNESSFIGQKQRWYLLKMLAEDNAVSFVHSDTPEFDHWRWVSYWYPLGQVVSFKQEVYRKAMKELAPGISRCLTYYA
jgi:putative (di)nucleoside polyphosphate hydrolase